MAQSKINENKSIKQNTGAILNPSSCGTHPTTNYISVGFAKKGICGVEN